MLKSAFQKRKMYESFLENVPLLKHLEVSRPSKIVETVNLLFQRYERENIADALVSQAFGSGDKVVSQVSKCPGRMGVIMLLCRVIEQMECTL